MVTDYERTLSLDDVRRIPRDLYPFMVFADNVRGIFSWGVKTRTKGVYGHFMWLIGPGTLASQGWCYRTSNVDHYASNTMKLVYNPLWRNEEKEYIVSAITADVSKPWYKTFYDIPGIIGELLGIDAINLPGRDFCSEHGKYLRLVDPEYNLKSPTPTELNLWTKVRGDRYKVYGRYHAGD